MGKLHLKEHAKRIVRNNGIIRQSCKVFNGWYVYNSLRHRFGKGRHYILIRGATGDVYIQLMLLREYVSQHKIPNYVILGDGACLRQLGNLFGLSDVFPLSNRSVNSLETLFYFLDRKGMNMIIPFFWTIDHWDCCVRMTERFSFMDSYVWQSFNMNYPVKFSKPLFLDDRESIQFWCQNHGVKKNKTVIISPEANSVTGLPIWFWNSIINVLITKGFNVFINCNHPTLYKAPNLFPEHNMMGSVLEYAGYFLGIRSGLCDIISTVNCRKIILYPKVHGIPDYGHHRSEAEFSDFAHMHYSLKNLTEISTPLLKNITSKDCNFDNFEDYYSEFISLNDQILSCFDFE